MTRHSSTTELLQEIRTMMTQLKSYLLQSTELQGMLGPQHQYTHDKLGTSSHSDRRPPDPLALRLHMMMSDVSVLDGVFNLGCECE